MKRIIASLLLCVLAIIAMGERPIATLKAQYTSWHSYINENNKKYYKEDKFILQISSRSSYFYDPQTFFVDSLNNDPVGSAI